MYFFIEIENRIQKYPAAMIQVIPKCVVGAVLIGKDGIYTTFGKTQML